MEKYKVIGGDGWLSSIFFLVSFCVAMSGCSQKNTGKTTLAKAKADSAMSVYFLEKGEALLDSDSDSAMLYLDSALALNKNNYRIHFARGHVFNEKKQHQKTLESFQAALAVNEEFTQGYLLTGMLLEKMGRPDEAIEQYRRVLDIVDGRQNIDSREKSENEINKVFAARLLDSAASKPELLRLIRKHPDNHLLKMLSNTSKRQLIDGFFSE